MADNTELSKMLSAEDKLDGNNYPMWSYMMGHVLVAKGFWNIVQGIDVRPGSVADSGTIEDVAGSRSYAVAAGAATSAGTSRATAPMPIAEQLCWDGRDA